MHAASLSLSYIDHIPTHTHTHTQIPQHTCILWGSFMLWKPLTQPKVHLNFLLRENERDQRLYIYIYVPMKSLYLTLCLLCAIWISSQKKKRAKPMCTQEQEEKTTYVKAFGQLPNWTLSWPCDQSHENCVVPFKEMPFQRDVVLVLLSTNRYRHWMLLTHWIHCCLYFFLFLTSNNHVASMLFIPLQSLNDNHSLKWIGCIMYLCVILW